jgi:O-antigen/teichoic acid export membrane protein
VARVLLGVIPVVVLANRLLIPKFGGVGAAAALVLGVALALVVVGGLAYRRYGALVQPRTLGRVALAAGAVAALAAAIPAPGALLFVKLAALGVLYLGILAVTGEITRADFGLPAAGRPPVTPAPSPAGDPPAATPAPRS